MATKGNGLPIKVYKRALTSSYLRTLKDSNSIINYLGKNQDPILQKQDRYIPPRTKGNILTEEYIKKMAEKPERDHIKRIPSENHLVHCIKSLGEKTKPQGIKIFPNKRVTQNSTKSYENYIQMRTYKLPNTLKHFYFDDFNSVKQNQYDTKYRSTKRYLHRPPDNDIIPPKPVKENNNNIYSQTFGFGFKKPVPAKTHDRIFHEEKKGRDVANDSNQCKGRIRRTYKGQNDHIGPLFESQGKIPIKREVKLTDKAVHDNYRILSSEAKKNLEERYYNNIW